MGQTDNIMMKSRPATYMYTPITRGHKPTPSQESNTLSEASCTTNLSVESGPLSPTYKEEEEGGRLQDFTDDDLSSGAEDTRSIDSYRMDDKDLMPTVGYEGSSGGHPPPPPVIVMDGDQLVAVRASSGSGGHIGHKNVLMTNCKVNKNNLNHQNNNTITSATAASPSPSPRVPGLGLGTADGLRSSSFSTTAAATRSLSIGSEDSCRGCSGGGGGSSSSTRDSVETVVRVSPSGTLRGGTLTYRCGTIRTCESSGSRPTTGHGQPETGMSRESIKGAAGNDYGSFAASGGVDGERGSTSSPAGQPLPAPLGTEAEAANKDATDNSIAAGDRYQRTPLLSDSECEDEPKKRSQTTAPSNNNNDRGAPLKLTMPPRDTGPNNEEEDETYDPPKERLKTLLAALFLASGFLATTTSLAVTHESVPEIAPLPDIVLDHVAYQQWGLDVSEYLIMVSTFSAFLVVMVHSHRMIILRRIWLMLGCLYFYRAVTMFVTVLPKSDPSYTCHPKLNNATALPALVIVKRVFVLMSGMGLSINGKHIYCGDYIFSGHTMVLTMGYLVIKEYSPRRCFILHWTSFLVSLAGVILLLIARGHYSIDCILAYYVTTRLWWIYHTLAHNNNLKLRGKHNFLDNIWWWLLFRYFEINIVKPLPRRYSLPFPDRLKNYVRSRVSCCRAESGNTGAAGTGGSSAAVMEP